SRWSELARMNGLSSRSSPRNSWCRITRPCVQLQLLQATSGETPSCFLQKRTQRCCFNTQLQQSGRQKFAVPLSASVRIFLTLQYLSTLRINQLERMETLSKKSCDRTLSWFSTFTTAPGFSIGQQVH